MNILKKILALAATSLISSNVLSWSRHEVEISKGNKLISVAIHYYSDAEWPNVMQHLKEEGYMRANRFVGYNLETSSFLVCNDVAHMALPTVDEIYKKYMSELHTPSKGFTELINLHNRCFSDPICCVEVLKYYNRSGLVIIAQEKDRDKGEKIFKIYEYAMQKIKQEDIVRFTEMAINGLPAIKTQKNKTPHMNFLSWTKFKNFVVNEKFLYAMAGLSALYFGYEYMNQK